MKKTFSRAGPALVGILLLCVAFLSTACLEVHAYDENSELHSMQAERNEVLVDGGMTDAEIDAAIDEAYALADPPPALPADGTDTPEAAAWRKRRDEIMPLFSKLVRQWCFTDLERSIRLNQADAWRAYEASKRGEGDDPPQLE